MDEPEDDTDISVLFGNCLKSLRNKKNLTQTQLSEKLGISQKHLSVIENGKQFPSSSLISRIARTLEVKPYELFGGTDHESQAEEKLKNEIIKSVRSSTVMLQNVIDSKFAVLLSEIRNNGNIF